MSATATEVTHFLFEAKPLWTGQIGTGGVADDTNQTIPLQSATNLDTGDVYVVTINRVDSNGTKTTNPSANTEVLYGKLSGTNLINSIRGVEGTAQAWEAGTVVEILFTATHWNKMIEFLGVEHSADGTHDATKLVMMTGNQTVAGVKTFASPVINTAISGTAILDEDDMASNSATKLATQQSIKTYVDSGTVTMTNKRITQRVVLTTDDATAVIDVSITDEYVLTAIANATTFTITGTPTDGQKLMVRFKDAGVAKALTWTGFTSRGATLPTTTVAGKWHRVGLIYNLTGTTFDCVAAIVEA